MCSSNDSQVILLLVEFGWSQVNIFWSQFLSNLWFFLLLVGGCVFWVQSMSSGVWDIYTVFFMINAVEGQTELCYMELRGFFFPSFCSFSKGLKAEGSRSGLEGCWGRGWLDMNSKWGNKSVDVCVLHLHSAAALFFCLLWFNTVL